MRLNYAEPGVRAAEAPSVTPRGLPDLLERIAG